MPAATRATLLLAILLMFVPQAVAQQTQERDRPSSIVLLKGFDDFNGELWSPARKRVRERHGISYRGLHATRTKTQKGMALSQHTRRSPSSIVIMEDTGRSKSARYIGEGKAVIAETDTHRAASGNDGGVWNTWGRCTAGIAGGSLLMGSLGSSSDYVDSPRGAILGAAGGALLGAGLGC